MDVKPSHYIFGILGFVFFVMAGVSLIGEFRQAQPTFGTDESFTEFNDTFNVYNEVESSVGQLEAGVTDAEPDMGVFGVLNSLIQSAWQTLVLTISSFGFMTAVFGGLSTVFGMPAWIGGLIVLAVSVMFVFAIFSAIFQRNL